MGKKTLLSLHHSHEGSAPARHQAPQLPWPQLPTSSCAPPQPCTFPIPPQSGFCENSQLVKFNLFKARHGWSPIMHKARDTCQCACFLAPSTLYSTKPVLDAYLQSGPSARGLPGAPRASCRNQPFFHCKQQGSIQSLTLASAKTPRLLQPAWPLHLKMAKLLLRKTASFLLM